MQVRLDPAMQRHKPLLHTVLGIDGVSGGSVADKLRLRFTNFSRSDDG